jgi:ribose 5-phosphate isomerase A
VEASRGALRLIEGILDRGVVVGLGTGSTVRVFIETAADLLAGAEGVVASSLDTALAARVAGLRVLDPRVYRGVNVYVDGADEVELGGGSMIKGGGAALLGEKILAAHSPLNIFIVGEDKVVEVLGERAPVPLDVEPSYLSLVLARIEGMGFKAKLREGSGKRGPVISDWGGVIVDVETGPIRDPAGLERRLESIAGVRASGLFVGLADYVVVGYRACGWRVYRFERRVRG